jgi:hypothetical protein
MISSAGYAIVDKLNGAHAMTSPMTTSQDYLQRLRERRQTRFATPAVPTETTSLNQEATQQETSPEQQPQQSTPEYQEVFSSVPQETQETVQLAPEPAVERQMENPTENQPTSVDQVSPAVPNDANDTDNANDTTISWTAPSRPFKKRNARFYTTITVIVILISLILFFAGQFLPIAAVVAVAFLGYVLASVPPEEVRYQLSSDGIRIENNLYLWDEMGYFWVEKKYGQEFIQVEIPRFPFRITLMMGTLPIEEMQKLFAELLPEQHPALTYMDKIAHWVEKNILLDET